MAILTRSNYIPNTLIQSASVNADFNQLVDLLSGVSTTKDALITFSNATDPVLRLDQLGAGIIQRWLQNGVEKAKVNNDGSFNIGTPGSSPTGGLVAGPDASGTNTAGAALVLHGGKGTGNAVPGVLGIRYGLIGASGTTVQSVSSSNYLPITNLFTNDGFAGNIANTTSETSLFTAVFGTGSAGSTRNLEAGILRSGTIVATRICGVINTTGTPTFQIRVGIGVAVASTGAVATPNNLTNALFTLDIVTQVFALAGASTPQQTFVYLTIIPTSGAAPVVITANGGTVNIDATATLTIDILAQWGTANASNVFAPTSISIDRRR